MPFYEIILIAVGLAMDAFTVAMAVGLHLSRLGQISPRQYFRLGFHFGLFQFLMPILGWLAGNTVHIYIKSFSHWLAAAILCYIGARLIVEGRRPEEYQRPDPTRGVSLVILSIATSIDALALGLSLAFLGSNIVYPSIVIGAVAAVFTLVGLFLGKTIGLRWRTKIACLGGIILIGIGFEVLLENLIG